MYEKARQPTLAHIWSWFDPRGRQVGTWAFIFNRVSAIGLTVYLYLHLIVLGRLAQGPDVYESFLELAHSPLFIFGEFLVVSAGIIHGLNGLRVALNSFGILVPYHKILFYILMLVAVVSIVIFGVRMLTV